LLLGLAIFTSLVDRRFSSQSLELEAREQRYNQILQTSFDAFVGMEPDGTITDWSKQAENIFGYSAHTAVGQKFLELILPPRYEQEFLEVCGQPALLGNDQEARRRCELPASCFGRRKMAIELTTSSIQIGAKRHLAAFIRDITEAKRAQEALNQSNELVAMLLNSASEAIYGADLDGTFTFCHPACAGMLGYESAVELCATIERLLAIYTDARSPVAVETAPAPGR
jgi:PAS domain S-box-containing protein